MINLLKRIINFIENFNYKLDKSIKIDIKKSRKSLKETIKHGKSK